MYENLMLGFITLAFFSVSMGVTATFIYSMWIDYKSFKEFKGGIEDVIREIEEDPKDPPLGR